MLKPDHPKGTLDLEVDADGDIWVGMMYQGGMARFDRKTEQFRIYPVPKEWQTDATQQSHFSVAGMKADGKVWVKNSDRSQVMKLDPVTGQYENLGSFKIPSNGRPIGIYGIYADQQNNAYILEFGNGGIGKIDAKTGAMAFYPTPTPFSRARRGRVDHENRLWFAEYGSNGVGMFDPKTEKITEWKKPLEWESPYDVVADRNGQVWEVNESSDRLGRLDPKTGEWVNYPLPRYSQLPPRVRRRPHLAGEGLGRQQSRRIGDQARAAGLGSTDNVSDLQGSACARRNHGSVVGRERANRYRPARNLARCRARHGDGRGRALPQRRFPHLRDHRRQRRPDPAVPPR